MGERLKPAGPSTPEEASELMLEGYHAGTVRLPEGAVVTCPSCGHEFTPGQGTAGPVRLTENDQQAGGREAMVGGQRSFDDIRELVRAALRARERQSDPYGYCFIADLTDSEVVYSCGGGEVEALWQCSYSIDDAGQVTLGEPSEVTRTYAPTSTAAQVAEAGGLVEERGQVSGRVLEAKGTDADGGRIFRMQIIAAGDSRNRRRYPLAVLHEAAALYEGAKAYDHHRTDSELQTSTIAGIVGGYRDVAATSQGLEADLHLLPGASHAAEVLDAALAGTLDAGVSHDVMALYKTTTEGGQRLQEATAIVKVNSVDIVADPAAGGKALRMVAGGDENVPPSEGGSPGSPPTTTPEPTQEGYRMDPKALRRALGLPEDATDEQVAARTAALREAFSLPADATPDQVAERAQRAREALGDSAGITPPAAPTPEPVREIEATVAKGSFLGRAMIREAVEAARLPAGALDQVTAALPDQITEAQVDRQVGAFQQVAAMFERAGLAPQAGNAQVAKESRDKKVEALDAMFAGDFAKGYHSFRQAWADITGARVNAFDGDVNRRILRESAGHGYDSAVRATEALDSTSWAQVLGDSITRRMVADYRLPGLDNWRLIVSDVVPLQDFRTQRRTRMGGYGTLPTVLEAAPYQPLTSPGDEEATYAPTKRGGLESITLEMIANDDVGSLRKIPQKLGRAAAWTLYRFVWSTLVDNAATTYDSVALFHASHGNTASSAALAQATLSTGRRTMRDQTAYGDSTEILGPSAVPRTLAVPNELEEIAFQLTTSAVAIPSSGNASDIPNLHTSLGYVVVDILTDSNDWFLVADPASIPTIEVGFLNGREDPELFTQADPSVGSMFDSDELTYKIRHVYGLTVLDHRGFYRGQG